MTMTMDEAMTRLITRARTLGAAITGVTEQFADELSELKVAIQDAEQVLEVERQRPQPSQSYGRQQKRVPRQRI